MFEQRLEELNGTSAADVRAAVEARIATMTPESLATIIRQALCSGEAKAADAYARILASFKSPGSQTVVGLEQMEKCARKCAGADVTRPLIDQGVS